MDRFSVAMSVRRGGYEVEDRNVLDSDSVRTTFRVVMRHCVLLASICAFAHTLIFAFVDAPQWRLAIGLLAILLVIAPGIGLSRAFPTFLAFTLFFISSVSAYMAVLALTFGAEVGFHFPLMIGFALAVISGRIGIASKIVLTLALLTAFVIIDRASSMVSVRETLGTGVGEAVRVFNIVVVATAMSVLMFRYFTMMSRQQAHLEVLATTDALTGLLNRRALVARSAEASEEMRTSGLPLSFVLCDIDHFKRINDRYGHSSGDAVIRHVAMTLARSFRASDHLGRWGGEEFLIILPGTDRFAALKIVERAFERVGASPIALGSVNIVVGLTAGVAELLAHETVEDVLMRADAALYVGKSAGRNRVVDAHSFPE